MTRDRFRPDDIRTRPAMYVGGRNAAGAEELVKELIACALDEFRAGRATRLDVRVHDDGSVEVAHDGEGLPFTDDAEAELEDALGRLDARSPKWAPQATLLLHGCGLATVSALSAWLTVRTWHDGQRYDAHHAEGRPTGPAVVVPDPAGRGTVFHYRQDPTILPEPPRLAELRAVLWEVAHLFAGLHVTLNDERFHVPDGLSALLPIFATESSFQTVGDVMWRTRVDVQRTGLDAVPWQAELVVQYCPSKASWSPPIFRGWCNGVRTHHDASHLRAVLLATRALDLNVRVALIHAMGPRPMMAGATRAELHLPSLVVPLRRAVVAAWRARATPNP